MAFCFTTLACFCAAAAALDLTSGRVPNSLNLAGFTAGMASTLAWKGVSGLPGSLAGSLLGFLLLAGPFALGMLGAGDVKFLAASGAIVGWRLLLPSFLAGAAIGGLAGLLLVLRRDRRLSRSRTRFFLLLGRWGFIGMPPAGGAGREPRFRSGLSDPRMPYAVALSAGLLLVTGKAALC